MAADLLDDPIYLLRQIAGGDRDAFRRLYDRYATLAFTFALRLLGSQSDAEDLLQEVFLQVWRQAQTYSPERGSPEAWLITITRSRAIDKLRSIRRRDMTISPLTNHRVSNIWHRWNVQHRHQRQGLRCKASWPNSRKRNDLCWSWPISMA